MRILITGASRGLGAVLVKHLMIEHEVITLTLDYSNPAVPQVSDVDAIIHCAGGGMGYRDPLLTMEQFKALFLLNLGTAIEINRMALPSMMAKGAGYIVHVCSIASGEAIGSVGYNTVKAALSAYIRSLGRELAPSGVVVTGIAPGAFLAPNNAMERLKANSPAAYQDFIDNRLPRKRMGTAEELIPLIKLLISPEASMMGGTVIPIDAGEGRYYG